MSVCSEQSGVSQLAVDVPVTSTEGSEQVESTEGSEISAGLKHRRKKQHLPVVEETRAERKRRERAEAEGSVHFDDRLAIPAWKDAEHRNISIAVPLIGVGVFLFAIGVFVQIMAMMALGVVMFMFGTSFWNGWWSSDSKPPPPDPEAERRREQRHLKEYEESLKASRDDKPTWTPFPAMKGDMHPEDPDSKKRRCGRWDGRSAKDIAAKIPTVRHGRIGDDFRRG
eukprot:gnl/TRDRNA2_/TRDRNA2_182908_c0_seq1.p2 gnl/TRDRNA2_/TRDRNA2_182908_c0~~gnl/TRDRNA2_/TRDRNA2_182908_c0_seq1.p2  ORF type:complete len:226 (+),score=43.38 gnl/TRDRNA2_/TRDRNA2_182908_c0_seq1:79-756(+)